MSWYEKNVLKQISHTYVNARESVKSTQKEE